MTTTVPSNTDATTPDAVCQVPAAAARTRWTRHQWRVFVGHYVEMVLAMFAGMLLLGLAQDGLLAATGATALERALDQPVVELVLMTAYMVVGMAGWMAIRRHPVRHNIEMNAAMVAPLPVLLPLQVAGVDVMVALHLAMFATMFGYMWWRRNDYCH